MIARRVLDKPLIRPHSVPLVRPPHALCRRLGHDGIQEVIAAYRAGATTPELVVRFNASKGALLGILHERGLAIRTLGLTSTEIDEAVRLRAAGLSYAAVGERLGVVGSTVWRVLQACDN